MRSFGRLLLAIALVVAVTAIAARDDDDGAVQPAEPGDDAPFPDGADTVRPEPPVRATRTERVTAFFRRLRSRFLRRREVRVQPAEAVVGGGVERATADTAELWETDAHPDRAGDGGRTGGPPRVVSIQRRTAQAIVTDTLRPTDATTTGVLRDLGVQETFASTVAFFGGTQEKIDVNLPVFAVLRAITAMGSTAVLDGATEAGIIQIVGKTVARLKHEQEVDETVARHVIESIGVAPLSVVDVPSLAGTSAFGTRLDQNHEKFILTPGNDFGDETPTMQSVLVALKGRSDRTVAVVVNGGGITGKEVAMAAFLKIPLLVLVGSGRFADSLALGVEQGEAACASIITCGQTDAPAAPVQNKILPNAEIDCDEAPLVGAESVAKKVEAEVYLAFTLQCGNIQLLRIGTFPSEDPKTGLVQCLAEHWLPPSSQ